MQKLLLLSAIFVLSSGCVKQQVHQQRHRSNETFSKFSQTAAELFEQTSQFLAYDKGYDLMIQEPARGIIVTDWVSLQPNLRSRLTIRVNRDVEGSILTIHRMIQSLQNNEQWIEEASDGRYESALLQEIRERLVSAQRQPQHKSQK